MALHQTLNVYIITISYYFYGTVGCENKWIFDSFAWSWDPFPSVGLPCPTLIWEFLLNLIFYFVLFCYYLLDTHSFLMRNRKGVNLEGRGGWGEIGGSRGSRNYNQDILYEIRISFQWEKKQENVYIISIFIFCLKLLCCLLFLITHQWGMIKIHTYYMYV